MRSSVTNSLFVVRDWEFGVLRGHGSLMGARPNGCQGFYNTKAPIERLELFEALYRSTHSALTAPRCLKTASISPRNRSLLLANFCSLVALRQSGGIPNLRERKSDRLATKRVPNRQRLKLWGRDWFLG